MPVLWNPNPNVFTLHCAGPFYKNTILMFSELTNIICMSPISRSNMKNFCRNVNFEFWRRFPSGQTLLVLKKLDGFIIYNTKQKQKDFGEYVKETTTYEILLSLLNPKLQSYCADYVNALNFYIPFNLISLSPNTVPKIADCFVKMIMFNAKKISASL